MHRRAVRQAIASPLPPGRKTPVREASVRAAVAGWIDAMLREDLDAPRKQRHTAKRVFERLRDEHGAQVSYSHVTKHVRRRRAEMAAEARGQAESVAGYVPQAKEPGAEAEVDFDEVFVELVGHLARAVVDAGGRRAGEFHAEGDEQMMTALGVQSKREITRTRIRVRTAMAARGWIISARPSHPALVCEEDFIKAQGIRAERDTGTSAGRRYLLAGLLRCGICGRRLESCWANHRPAYRRRHGHSSAATPDPARPKNLYIREDHILPHLPAFLAGTAPTAERRRRRTGRGIDVPRPVTEEDVISYLRTREITLTYDPRTRTLRADTPTQRPPSAAAQANIQGSAPRTEATPKEGRQLTGQIARHGRKPGLG